MQVYAFFIRIFSSPTKNQTLNQPIISSQQPAVSTTYTSHIQSLAVGK